MTVKFITACRNAASNIPSLVASVREQTSSDWTLTLIDDASTDGTRDVMRAASSGDERISVIENSERKHALRNIVEAARTADDDSVIATLDGDDVLCNAKTVSYLLSEYARGADVVWTAHRWDTNGMNISGHMPDGVDPYAWPWVSSHLRTFRKALIDRISDENFKDTRGQWFKRGYDQALMLPVLKVASRRVFLPEVCYQYNINTSSIPAGERNLAERDQISTVNIVRSRGFLR